VDEVLAQAGFTRSALLAPDAALPLDTFRELWARAAVIRPTIGLDLVERFPDGQMHMLAHLAMRSATVEAALNDVCRYAALTSAADHLSLTQHGAVARFSYHCDPRAPHNPWMAEHYLAMAVVFLSKATGRALPVRRVEFAAPAQAPLAAYRPRFSVVPEFDRAHNILEFDRTTLSWPLLTHDAYLHAILERVAQSHPTRPDMTADALLESVRREIAKSLLKGETPTIDRIANSCRLGPRALRDRLARMQSSFRQLLDDTRRDLARDHLARELSVNETAYLLGFSEPSAFQHACKRWFDRSAGELRRDLLQRHAKGE
jgi:AraC-like DNA-binding protein